MVCEILVYQPFNNLTRLLAREYFTEGKPVQAPINPPQMLYGLTRERIQASVVTGRRQTS
jgi:hypothetical protein